MIEAIQQLLTSAFRGYIFGELPEPCKRDKVNDNSKVKN